MSDTKLYIPFYYDWADNLAPLADEDVGKLLRAIIELARDGVDSEKVSELSPMAKMAYKFIASSIDRSEKKRLAGQKGGLARAQNARARESSEACGKCDEKEDKSPTKNENISENNQNKGENCEKTEKFTTPTLSEVRDYFREKGFTSNPDEFFNFYESNGWRVGQNPMKNWKSSAENWEIKAKRPTSNMKTDENNQYMPHFDDKRSYDVHEAFKLALERSYGPDADEEEEGE